MRRYWQEIVDRVWSSGSESGSERLVRWNIELLFLLLETRLQIASNFSIPWVVVYAVHFHRVLDQVEQLPLVRNLKMNQLVSFVGDSLMRLNEVAARVFVVAIVEYIAPLVFEFVFQDRA